jgi:uncharacterized protein (TIGR02118 family)
MIKVIFCLRRLPGLRAEQFYAYWLEKHSPLVRKHAAVLRIKRYVQSHTFDHAELRPALEARGAGIPPYDGVAELWWDSLEDLRAAGRSEEGRKAGRALLADERKFIDLENSSIFYAREHVVVP